MNSEEAVEELTNNSKSTINVLWPARPGQVESGNGETPIVVRTSFWPTPSGLVENGCNAPHINSASSSGRGKDTATFNAAGQKTNTNKQFD